MLGLLSLLATVSFQPHWDRVPKTTVYLGTPAALAALALLIWFFHRKSGEKRWLYVAATALLSPGISWLIAEVWAYVA